jgi:hypothetical protein
MNEPKIMCSRSLPERWRARTTLIAVLLVTLIVTLMGCSGTAAKPANASNSVAQAQAASTTQDPPAVQGDQSIFRPFPNDDGKVQSAPDKALNLPDLGANNPFFQVNFGACTPGTVPGSTVPTCNGQSCATCHRPEDGMTVHVSTINNAFTSSGGQDPLFRFNDTANDPNSPKVNSTNLADLKDVYSLTLALGVTRIGRVVPAPNTTNGFSVTATPDDRFGPLPCDPLKGCTDPQQIGKKTISLFRRPLVQTNMRFDSAILWDGREDIRDIRAQVTKAAKGLLLNPGVTPEAADAGAHSQFGIFTDQVIDDRSSFPSSFAGNLSAQHALGGVDNLINFAHDPTGPCIFTAANANGPRELTRTNTPSQPSFFDVTGSLSPPDPPCTHVDIGGPNMTTFQAWLNIPIDDTDITNISRRRIAHGEEIFNKANLTIDTTPPDGSASRDENELRLANQLLAEQLGVTTGQAIHCTTCHATNNIGNHPEASFFVRIGSDSVPILRALADRDHNTDQFGNLDNFVTRTQMLPQYCLRSAKTVGGVSAPPLPGAGVTGAVACGDFQGMPAFCKPTSSTCIPGDVITSDPGRAMTTGNFADIGKFKPPILRGLATRSPYFHGSAADSTVSIIEFYNVRFNIGLSEADKEDLVRFVEAH